MFGKERFGAAKRLLICGIADRDDSLGCFRQLSVERDAHGCKPEAELHRRAISGSERHGQCERDADLQRNDSGGAVR